MFANVCSSFPLIRPHIRRSRSGLAVAAGAALLVVGSAAPTAAQAVPRARTPEERFANIKGYPFAPHYAEINTLRMHYVDEGRAEKGTMLLLHGEPSWSFLYRNMIPVFVRAGYRVIAPDMIGFGKSDKVTEPSWYTLDAHVGMLRGLVERLDLRNVTILVQDWGGPIGLVTATDMPERFARLMIMNTWLDHPGYKTTQALRDWNARAPNVDFSALGGRPWLQGSSDDPETIAAGYSAPFPPGRPDLQVGAHRWPWMLPFMNPAEGGAARTAAAYEKLASWRKPAHVSFGDRDAIFTVAWGREFAAHIPGATFDVIEGAGHMVQETGAPLAELMLKRIAEER